MSRAATALSLVCVVSAVAAGQAPDLEHMDLVLKAVPNGPRGPGQRRDDSGR